MDSLSGRLEFLRENYILHAAPLLLILGVSAGHAPNPLAWVALGLLVLLTLNWLAGFGVQRGGR